jgi:hypothetical protein
MMRRLRSSRRWPPPSNRAIMSDKSPKSKQLSQKQKKIAKAGSRPRRNPSRTGKTKSRRRQRRRAKNSPQDGPLPAPRNARVRATIWPTPCRPTDPLHASHPRSSTRAPAHLSARTTDSSPSESPPPRPGRAWTCPAYIPMSPMSGIPAPPPFFFSGFSAMSASVVRSNDATLAAFWSAARTTLVGSMTPASTRSS